MEYDDVKAYEDDIPLPPPPFKAYDAVKAYEADSAAFAIPLPSVTIT